MKKPMFAKDIVLDALLMAIWRRRSKEPMIITQTKAHNIAVENGRNSVKGITKFQVLEETVGIMLLLNLF